MAVGVWLFADSNSFADLIGKLDKSDILVNFQTLLPRQKFLTELLTEALDHSNCANSSKENYGIRINFNKRAIQRYKVPTNFFKTNL